MVTSDCGLGVRRRKEGCVLDMRVDPVVVVCVHRVFNDLNRFQLGIATSYLKWFQSIDTVIKYLEDCPEVACD